MIALIFCGDIKYCPYLSRYTERLEMNNIDFEVWFWNRGGFNLNVKDNYYYFDSPSSESLTKAKKAIDFIDFRKWVVRRLKNTAPEKVILLSTLTGILLYDKLKKYRKKYIFDIRDYSYENISLFRSIEGRIIKQSALTAISSKGFKSFLPDYDYVIAHNFNRNEMLDSPQLVKQDLPLDLVWNGTVRFFDFQRNYINCLRNDPRFRLVYHGAGTALEEYKEYCRINNVKNAVFTGPYNNSDKAALLRRAAILNNCYGGRDGDQLRFAISNRYYDGLIYHIPQLVEPGGYKASVTEAGGVGIALEAGSDFADRLYDYYMSLDQGKFDAACDEELGKVLAEDDLYIEKIDEFIRS